MNAAETLRKAADLIEERGKQRDQPNGEKSMAKAVKAFWEIHGTAILARGHMTETEGWHFMEVLKMVRSAYGVYVADDFEDKVAYAALAAEAAAGTGQPGRAFDPADPESYSDPVAARRYLELLAFLSKQGSQFPTNPAPI